MLPFPTKILTPQSWPLGITKLQFLCTQPHENTGFSAYSRNPLLSFTGSCSVLYIKQILEQEKRSIERKCASLKFPWLHDFDTTQPSLNHPRPFHTFPHGISVNARGRRDTFFLTFSSHWSNLKSRHAFRTMFQKFKHIMYFGQKRSTGARSFLISSAFFLL